MPIKPSRTSTHGRNMAGARSLWRATGMRDADFGKPIVAVVNSQTDFVPGHMHLWEVGRLVGEAITAAGGVAREMNTIAIDDGIAMGHEGMLYSLPSRELIADSIEYMVRAHCVDALVCISNCDKITPGMLMAALRLNLPTVFLSGGPMEAGRVVLDGRMRKVDLADAMVMAASDGFTDEEIAAVEASACPTCGSCSGLFTANSMNCLLEALGLALPGNGTLVATHIERRRMAVEAGRLVVHLARRWYDEGDAAALPRSIAARAAFENAMTLDVAMGGSSNTVLHLLAAAYEGAIDFTLDDVERISRRTPCLCKLSPSVGGAHVEDLHRAGGTYALLGELARMGLLDLSVPTVHMPRLAAAIERWDVRRTADAAVTRFFLAAPGGRRTTVPSSQDLHFEGLDLDREAGVVRSERHAHSRDGGIAVLRGNLALDGCIVKTAGVDPSILTFRGRARVFESQEAAVEAILADRVAAGDVVVIRYEGPKGGPGMQEMLYPTSYLKSKRLEKVCALITDGRFSGATSGLSIGHVSPEAAEGGLIGLVEDGDPVAIDIPGRRISLDVSSEEIERRRDEMVARGAAAWRPLVERPRWVSGALAAYASTTTSASTGAVRVVRR